MDSSITSLQVIDSHTGGEPTRVVVGGIPDLGSGSMAQRLERLRSEHDYIRTGLLKEPRGADVMVGALLCQAQDPAHTAGVIFFNNVGYLGMCGHGLLGLMATLSHMGHIKPGQHLIETPVGVVSARVHNKNRSSIHNVPSYRYQPSVAVQVAGHGLLTGDIAWGGNWFFLVSDHGKVLDSAHTEELTDFAWRIRQGLEQAGITGENGAVIDHIELFAPPSDPQRADSRSFVLCPGKEYDRSPCGTGTSAKLACLYAGGHLKPGQLWRQESIIGSVFEASIESVQDDGSIVPVITGDAYVNGELTLLCDLDDPFAWGIN